MDKVVLTFEEACEYTGFTKSYMYKLTSARKIPHSKPNGKKIFFHKMQLDKWLLGNPVATNEQINAEASTYITAKKNKARN